MPPARLLVMPLLVAGTVHAADPILEPPDGLPLNYRPIPVGTWAPLEGGAYVARASDSEAGWHNPAGLALSDHGSVSGNTALFEYVSLEVSRGDAHTSENTFLQVPSLVGTAFQLTPESERNWVLGAYLATPNSWAQEVSLGARYPDGANTVDLSLESRSSSLTIVPGLAVGWRLDDTRRLGFGLEVSYTGFESIRTVNKRTGDALGNPVERSFQAESFSADVYQMQFTGGFQWEINDRWSIGIAARSPSFELYDKGRIRLDSFFDNSTFTADGVFAEDNLNVSIQNPWELSLAAAYHAERWDLELLLRGYGGIGNETIIDVNNPFIITVTDKSTSTTSTISNPVNDPVATRDFTIVLAIGGRYHMSESWALHSGLQLNPSPVNAEESTTFREADLLSLAFGTSRTSDHVDTTFGIILTAGSNPNSPETDLTNDATVTSDFRLLITTLVFGTTYRF